MGNYMVVPLTKKGTLDGNQLGREKMSFVWDRLNLSTLGEEKWDTKAGQE